jgi:hypothetical protein
MERPSLPLHVLVFVLKPQTETNLTHFGQKQLIPMEVDKSPETSLATSIFLKASSHSQRFTQSRALKSVDFSLVSILKAPKRKTRRAKMIQTDQMQDIFSSNLDRMAFSNNIFNEQIL